FDSAIKHLQAVESQWLSKVKAYRTELLNLAIEDTSRNQSQDQQELQQLSVKIESFKEQLMMNEGDEQQSRLQSIEQEIKKTEDLVKETI
ncbi:hypothetical protein ABTK87_19475, partial [Acinetobacter baumannii]